MQQGKPILAVWILSLLVTWGAGALWGWAGGLLLLLAILVAWWSLAPWLAESEALRQRAGAILSGAREIGVGSAERDAPAWQRAYDRLLEELSAANAERHELAEEIRSHSFEDRLTGLGNRHFFDSRFQVYAREREEASGGAVLLLQLTGLERLDERDEQAQEDLLKQTAVVLEGATRDVENVVLARRGQSDFAILAPLYPANQLPGLANKLVRAVTGIVVPDELAGGDLVHLGVVQYRAGDEPYAILAQADMALRTAQLQGPNSWYMYEQGAVPSEQVRGSVKWRTLLESALERRRLLVHFQPVFATDGHQVLHYEALSRLPDDGGELIKAAVFLPMARSLGLAPQLDRLAVDLIVKQLILGTEAGNEAIVSINLSAESLLSNQFMTWLRTRLVDHPKLSGRLMFEIDEYTVTRHGDALNLPFQYLRELGCRLVVDHVGLAITKALYLSERRFDCVKLHSSVVRDIDQASPNQLFARSVHSLCVESGIPLLAEGVETEAEWTMLKSLGVSGGQGYFLGAVRPSLS